jgi:hypothetical protein
MTDFTSHLPKNWNWYEFYRNKLGHYQLLEYTNQVYRLFINMKPGTFFSIEKNVTEENRDLFIKTCCMFIDETYHAPLCTEGYFELSSDCTILSHRNKPLLNDYNRRSLRKDKQRS